MFTPSGGKDKGIINLKIVTNNLLIKIFYLNTPNLNLNLWKDLYLNQDPRI